jgi:purine-binding chemotaxis protein CheW
MGERRTQRADDLVQLVSFSLAGEEFGVDILKVQEINRMTNITRVPDSPPSVEGVINLRGRLIPIIDLRGRFGMERKEPDKHTRVVVVELHGAIMGFVVDAVQEVLRVRRDVMEPPPELVSSVKSEYVTAVAKLDDRLLILLDLDKVLSSEEHEALQETGVAP